MLPSLRLATSAATLALFVAACVQSTPTPNETVDASVSDGGASGTDAQVLTDATTKDATSDGAVADAADAAELKCTSIGQQGQPVTITNTKASPPIANGGGFADGTYVRTSVKTYGDPPAVATAKPQTIVVTSTSIKLVTGVTDGTEQRTHLDYRSREQYAFFKVYCDTVTANVGTEFDASYESTATTITLYTEATDGTTSVVETTYTKQ